MEGGLRGGGGERGGGRGGEVTKSVRGRERDRDKVEES